MKLPMIIVALLVVFVQLSQSYRTSFISRMQLKRSTLLLDSMIDCQRGEFDKDVIVQSKSIPVIVDFYAGKYNI